VRDKDIVAASDCRGSIVFETLCGIYVVVDHFYYRVTKTKKFDI